MTNLTRFDNDGIEVFINTDTGESFASLNGAARMADEHPETIKRFLLITNTQTTSNEIDTGYGKKLVTFLDEDAILVVLEKYNPSRLKQFAKLGIRTALHQIAGYQQKPVASQPTLEPIDIFNLDEETMDRVTLPTINA